MIRAFTLALTLIAFSFGASLKHEAKAQRVAAAENPCDSGRGGDALQCVYGDMEETYKDLSWAAYEALGALPINERKKYFDVVRFMDDVNGFCEKQTKDAGGGAWPEVWAASCAVTILKNKSKEFAAWKVCEGHKYLHKAAACKFPTEDFDKSKDYGPGSK